MNCFPCFTSKNNDNNNEEVPVVAHVKDPTPPSPPVNNKKNSTEEANIPENGNNGARTFTFRELAMATKNFRQETLLGEGGFGKLYRGTLQTGEVVAVKRLDRNGTQGNKEFLVEVLMLTLLHHPNLVSLLGYCADGEQRLLVYEYLPFGSLDSFVHDLSADKKPLDWQARMKIACGAAQGLEYLHEKANPSIVYRDMKMSNILLDEEYNPKLSDYGIAKLAQGNTKMHISPGVMGSYGHCAPEYERHGELTTKSDIYCFGVVLLEIITGRKSLDTTRPTEEQNLVTWAQPFFKDPKRFPLMADPLLKMEFPERSINQAIGIAAMCLQDEPSVRPMIGDVVAVLSFLAVAPPGETIAQMQSASKPSTEVKTSGAQDHSNHSDSSDHEDGENNDEYTSNSDYESSGSSIVSDDEDGGNAAHRDEDSKHLPHQESKKGKKSLSSKHTKKHKSKKIARKDSSSHKKKKSKDDKGSISFRSSSSGSSHHSSRRSANLRQTSIEESQDGSSGTSLERGRYEESFSWSIGSSSRYKSRSGSGHIDSESGRNIKLHNSSHKSSRHESSSMRSKNASTNSNSRHSRSEDESYSSSDSGDDEIEHESES